MEPNQEISQEVMVVLQIVYELFANFDSVNRSGVQDQTPEA